MKKWMDLIMEFDADEMRRKRQYEYDESCAGEFKEKKKERNKKGVFALRFGCSAITMRKALIRCRF